jgi:hypothetical protein
LPELDKLLRSKWGILYECFRYITSKNKTRTRKFYG